MDEISGSGKMLIKCAEKVYGSNIKESDLKRIEEGYGDYKGYWEYYLRNVC
jgi:3-methyladenine DNA glycosylase/8-oxoguanine DNA glycosylase